MSWSIDLNTIPFLDQHQKISYGQDSLCSTPSPTLLNPYPNPTQPINSIIDLSTERLVQSVPKGGKKVNKGNEETKEINRGHWSHEQNKKYHWFLEMHYKHFVNRHLRRMDKIFKTMEIFIGTRQAEQCRSHHQKMEKKYHNFITIICNLRNQHYSTLDPQPIYDEITSLSINPPDGIATIKQLEEQQMLSPPLEQRQRKKQTPSVPAFKLQVKQQCKVDFQPQRLQQQKSQQVNLNNILDESNMDMGWSMLYHERPDSNCLFNSLLDP